MPRSSNSSTPACVVVIPARIGSTRLPRKLLLRDTGKTVIQHTYEAAQRARLPAEVIVATDDDEIFREVEAFGGKAVMTDPACASGTDRVAEVARQLQLGELIVNVQGDEPEISCDAIDLAVRMLAADESAVMSTLGTPIRSRDHLQDPACVKVVCDEAGRALYFSRSPIPHAREWDDALLTSTPPVFLQHLGLYGYRRDFLLRMATLPPSRLERIEKLEQLRVLEAGHTIRVGLVDHSARGIDTPDDYRAFVQRQRKARAA